MKRSGYINQWSKAKAKKRGNAARKDRKIAKELRPKLSS